MMWKENYKIGVEQVDTQHKELFDRTEALFNTIQSEDAIARKQECINAILFLKDYAVKHFAMEEKYQESICYSDIEKHKALHKDFINTVLEAEKKMLEADFSIPTIKEFAGFLTAWLIYHVAGADQKLRTGKMVSDSNVAMASSYVDCFEKSIKSVLETMVGLTTGNIFFDVKPTNEDDIRIQVELIGDHEGDVIFTFPRETTFALIKAMTFMKLDKIDEMAYSALSEIVNIISGNAVSLIVAGNHACNIKPPKVITNSSEVNIGNGFYLDTEFGSITVSVNAK